MGSSGEIPDVITSSPNYWRRAEVVYNIPNTDLVQDELALMAKEEPILLWHRGVKFDKTKVDGLDHNTYSSTDSLTMQGLLQDLIDGIAAPV